MHSGYHPSIFARETPEKAAYIMADGGEIVSYQQLDERSNQAAHLFRALGIERGDVIAIHSENNARFLELCWAAQRSGLYYTPLPWHLTPDEISYILLDSDAKLLIASTRFSDTAISLASTLPESIKKFSIGGSIPGYSDYQHTRDEQPRFEIPDEAQGTPLLYTSGTTGFPKGVKQVGSEDTIDTVGKADYAFHKQGYDQNAVTLVPGPLYHAAPLFNTMRTQRFGGTSIVVDHFDPEHTLRLIEKHEVGIITCVPTYFVRFLNLPATVRHSYNLSSLSLVLHTAAPCPVEIKYQMIDWLGPILLEYYGGTEGIGGTAINSHDWLNHPGSVGKSTAGRVRVVDEDTWEEVPRNSIGVLYFETPMHFEYHNDPEKTQSMSSPQGWRTLGDIGYMDLDDFVYLTDRKAHMIITGGVNVYPQEAENRLCCHPKVLDAAVFGIPNPSFGEEVKAVVELVKEVEPSNQLKQELIEYCKEALAPVKCPRSIDFELKLPRQENGKLYKRILIDRYK